MRLKSITKVKNIQNKRVLLRVDFNVAVGSDGRVGSSEDFKLRRVLPTIKYLLDRDAKLIIITHLGRPHGKKENSLKLDPIADRLNILIRKRVNKLNDCVGEQVASYITNMQPGQIVLLENLRFHVGEEKNSKQFAKKLAALGDIYVNDAFAVSHHPAASLSAITEYLPSYAGLLMQSEVSELGKILKRPKRPLVAILGGAKISTKLGLIDKIARQADWVLVGGGLANNFLAGLGYEVGKSLVEPGLKKQAASLYKKHKEKIILPIDVTVDDVKTKQMDAYQKDIEELKKYDSIIDLGTKTIIRWSEIIKQAKMIFWNGPVGLIEDKKASHASRALTELLAARSKRKCFTIIGGGETVWLIQEMGLFDDFDYVSTGGGAMIEFLDAGTLPALKPLVRKLF